MIIDQLTLTNYQWSLLSKDDWSTLIVNPISQETGYTGFIQLVDKAGNIQFKAKVGYVGFRNKFIVQLNV